MKVPSLILLITVLMKELTGFATAENLNDQADPNSSFQNSHENLGSSPGNQASQVNGISKVIQQTNQNEIGIHDLTKDVRGLKNRTRNTRSNSKADDLQVKKSYYALTSGCKLISTDDIPRPHSLYYLCDMRKNWHAADQHCKAHGMDLAVINYNFIFTSLVRSMYHTYIKNRNFEYYRGWIGGTDLGSVGNWYWAKNRHPITSNLWYSGEPNNVNGNEHCLGLGQVGATSSFGFFDFDCSGDYEFLCEVAEI